MDVRTIPDLLRYALRTHPKRDAFLVKREGRWEPVSTEEFAARVGALAASLRARGVRHGDRIVILSENRLEWAIADFATLSIAAISVPLYPTLPAAELAPLLAESTPVGAFVSTRAQREKIEVSAAGTGLRWIHCFDEEPLPAGAEGAAPGAAGTSSGAAGGTSAPAEPSYGPTSDDVATLIFTSGTGGPMKAAALTHGNLIADGFACLAVLQIGPADTHLSFLPLCHVFERTAGELVMIYCGATIAYAESMEAVPRDLMEIRPTVLLAVPRFWEKILERITAVVESSTGVMRALFRWGRRVALEWARRDTVSEPIPALLALQHKLASWIVYPAVAVRLGGWLRLRISGGAALSRDVALFFHGIGQTIHEGYGLTETSPVVAVNSFAHYRLGTVGRPLPGVDVRIAEDGEILVRGPIVMKGYWNLPDVTATALEGGWFHTGDIGVLDAEGFLRVTDRKKDVIVTSGGKKIIPQPIENALKQSPRIAEAILVGDGRKYAAALIAPGDGATREAVAEEVARVNEGLAPFERIKKFELIPNDLSIENGHLTPSLKVKRQKVAERFRDLIDRMYRES